MKPHTIEYRHMGKTYLMSLAAESIPDAEARLRSAYFNGEAQEVVFRVGVGKKLGKIIERIADA